jgi:hypothetical protein
MEGGKKVNMQRERAAMLYLVDLILSTIEAKYISKYIYEVKQQSDIIQLRVIIMRGSEVKSDTQIPSGRKFHQQNYSSHPSAVASCLPPPSGHMDNSVN